MGVIEIIIRLLAGVALILANAFFVVTEFALTRTRQFEESKFKEHPGLRKAWEMTRKLEIYLTGCQLGISSTSVLLGVVTEPAVTYVLKPLMELLQVPSAAVPAVSVTVAVVLINLIHKIWGEQAPTYLGVERPIQVARYCAIPLYWWCKITAPLIYAGDGLAKWSLELFGVKIERSWLEAEEGEISGSDSQSRSSDGHHDYTDIRREMGEILSNSVIPKDREKEVLRALEIDNIPVRDIMVKRDDIVAIPGDQSIEDNLKLMAGGRRFVRFPLIGESVDDLRGTLYLPEIFRHLDQLRSGDKTLSEVATPPMTVPDDLPVSRLIDQFQEEKHEMAFVRKDDKTIGLVTVTEALEAIAGDLKDPFDAEVEPGKELEKHDDN